jgi:mannose-6-phosphate isomerase-like protein (cupin superfamily)
MGSAPYPPRRTGILPLGAPRDDQDSDNGLAMNDDSATGRFDIAAIAAAMPETAKTLLIDTYLTNREQASSRVFRVYRPTPPHYHATCDEYLYVFSGRGTFWMKDASTKAEFAPGQLLFFERGTVHAMPELFEHPVVFLSIDTPRREPTDIIFVDPNDGSPETFMARNAKET